MLVTMPSQALPCLSIMKTVPVFCCHCNSQASFPSLHIIFPIHSLLFMLVTFLCLTNTDRINYWNSTDINWHYKSKFSMDFKPIHSLVMFSGWMNACQKRSVHRAPSRPPPGWTFTAYTLTGGTLTYLLSIFITEPILAGLKELSVTWKWRKNRSVFWKGSS